MCTDLEIIFLGILFLVIIADQQEKNEGIRNPSILLHINGCVRTNTYHFSTLEEQKHKTSLG